jgi:bacterioferritin
MVGSVKSSWIIVAFREIETRSSAIARFAGAAPSSILASLGTHLRKRSFAMSETSPINRKKMIELLNEDLSREYQAIIAYVNYSQVLKGAQYMDIARELEKHAAEELSHALKISKQIDYLGGMPTVTPKPVKTSDKATDMLKFDLENERVTVVNYRTRIRQADAMGEFALSETLREIIVQEQDHMIDLASALGIDVPDTSASA